MDDLPIKLPGDFLNATERELPEDFRQFLPPREAHEGHDTWSGPVYWLWVYDPVANRVTVEDNEDRPRANHLTHEDIEPQATHEARMQGYAYKIKGGYRITDDQHTEVEDPYVVKLVVAALNKEKQTQPGPHPRYHGLPS